MVTPRRPLRSDIHKELRERIVTSQYPPGEKLRDTELAEELQVSRTPIREALLRLEHEGFVETRQGRGFLVKPLTRQEVEDVYPLIISLETTGLMTSGPLGPTQLKQMEELAGAIAAAKGDVVARTDLDTQWHAVLLSGCINERLHHLLADLKQVARRYELAYMEEEAWVARSAVDHREIIHALAHGGPSAAKPVLERHWKFGMDAVLGKIS